ncbi:MAG: ABC-2 transporter permease [Defluviitaleaceae bacterium]|nr:ABC-2 transporter permease [Defluviitaleaceae bacterium]
MCKIRKFITLEFISIKPDLKPKNLLIFTVLAVVGFIIAGPPGMLMGIFPIATNIVSSSFSAGTDGLDALYGTLAITRKTVVRGRYLFAFIIAAIFSIFYFMIVALGSMLLQNSISTQGLLLVTLVFFIFQSIMSIVDLPILFKIGFKRARLFVGMFPLFVLLMFMLISRAYGTSYESPDVFEIADDAGAMFFNVAFLRENIFSLTLAVISWLSLASVSFVLSLNFYTKRDF